MLREKRKEYKEELTYDNTDCLSVRWINYYIILVIW